MTTDQIARAVRLARDYLVEHPDEGRSTDSLAVASIETGLRCRVEGPGGVVAHTDMPTGVGGGATAPSPGWHWRAAYAACIATQLAMRAAEVGVDLGRVEVAVGSVSDDRGMLGVDPDVRPGPESVSVLIRTDPGPDERALQDLLAWVETHSPVGDALRRAVPLHLEVTSLRESSRAGEL